MAAMIFRAGVLWIFCLILLMSARIVGAFVPEGAQFAFSTFNEDSSITIYLTDFMRQLTVPLAFNVDRSLSFSPARQLVYSQQIHEDEFAIFLMAGSEGQRISPVGVRDQYPVWSPDGTRVAFISSDETFSTLYVMNADGSQRQALAHETCPHILTIPTWLPDNQHIIFRYGDAEVQTACVVDSLTGETWDFSHETDIHAMPAWSPDGRSIVFAFETPNFANIYIADIEHTRVTNVRALTDGSQHFNTTPRWSPDGRSIAFVSNRLGNRDIYVMDSDGSNVRNVSHNRVNDFNPVWSPDSTQIAFISNDGGDWGITLSAADGTSAQPLAHHSSARPILMSWLP
jgi:Tol biopolymer transport system component